MIEDDADLPEEDDLPENEEEAEAALLKRAHDDWRRCTDYFADNYRDYRDDVRFARLGEQWDEKTLEDRKTAGRPALVINKLPPFIRQVVNDARQNKPQIKVLPQDSDADPETADIYSGLIRNIESASDSDVAYDTALDCAATGGFGFFRLNLAYAHDESWDQDIVFERIANPLMVYGDPDSQAADSSDWNICFVGEMIEKKEYKRRYPDADPVDFEAWPESAGQWREGEKVLVAEYWTREETRKPIVLLSNGQVVDLEAYETNAEQYQLDGVFPQGEPRDVVCYQVTQHIVSGAAVLATTEWAGRYIPIVPVYGEEVNIDGRRYLRSLIRDAKDAQVLYNVSRSASAEFVSLAPKAPFIVEENSLVQPEKWDTANQQNWAYLEVKKGSNLPQRQGMPSPATGPLQEALTSSDEMKGIIGIYDAGVGARSNETSGVAIRARVQESDTATFHFVDNLSRAIRHAGRILIDLIPKVYSAGRVIRILGEDGEPTTVMVAEGEEAAAAAQVKDAQGKRIEAIYALGVGRYDLTVSVGPGFNTRREEAATQMIEAARAFPGFVEIAGDLLAKNLDWPGADEIADRWKAMMETRQGGQGQAQPQQPPPDPAALVKAQTDQFTAQTNAAQNAEKLRIDAFNAETARIKAMHEISQPTRLRVPEPADFSGA